MTNQPLDPALVATLHQMHFYFTASLLLPVIRGQAQHRTWDDLADRLTPNLIGKTLTSLRLHQTRTKKGRQYTITLAQLIRFIDAYRLTLPDILRAYTRFREETLRAEIPPGTPGAPLAPPSPALLAHLVRLLRPQPAKPRP